MALNLKKGGKLNLAKEAPKLKIAGVGLGWVANQEEDGPDFDLDVSAFLLTDSGKVPADEYVVFYGSELKMDTPDGTRPYSGDGSVIGAIDEQEGEDEEDNDGDSEDMKIEFDKIWEGIKQIVITVTITKYPNDTKKDKRTLLQNFGMVNKCYIRVWDDKTGVEILRYDLNEKFNSEDAVEFGRFVRFNDSWEFIATGEKYNGGLDKFAELFM